MFRPAERSSTPRGLYSKAFRPVALLPVLLFLVSLVVSHLNGFSRSTQAASVEASGGHATDVCRLAPGGLITRELPDSSPHLYEINLAAGQYARIHVAKGDAGLSATLFGPDGRRLDEFISRRYGPLRLALIAEESGPYRLELRSLEAEGPQRVYNLKVEEVRDATPRDKEDERAERLFAEAERQVAAWDEQSLHAAVQKYAEAREYWQSGAQLRRAAESLEAIGEVHFTLGEYRQALTFFEKALAASRAARDTQGEMWGLNDIGRVYVFLGKSPQVLAYSSRVLEHYRRLPALGLDDRRAEAAALNNRGAAQYSLSKLGAARDDFDRALALWVKAGDRGGQALAHRNLGYTYADTGDLQKAGEQLEQSLALCSAVGDRRGEALARTGVGTVSSLLGERQKALDSHQQAMQIFRTIGDRQGEAVTLNSVGKIYEDLNEPQTALDHYLQALELYRGNQSRDSEAVTLYYVGRVYRTLGDFEQALAYYRKCLSLSRALGKRRVEAYAFTDISLIYKSQGKKQAALGQFDEVLKVYRRAGDRRGQANTLKYMGDIYRESGELRQAMDCYERALRFRRLADDRNGEAAILYAMAGADRDGGNLDGALRHVTESIELIEALRAQVASPQLRASYFASVRKHYELYILLLMQMHKLRPADGYAAAALRASEHARARSLLETLLEAHADLRRGADPTLLERERSLEQTLNVKAFYQMRLPDSQRAEAEEVGQEIRRLTNEYQEVQSQIRTQSPRYASLTQPQTLRLEDIHAELQDDKTILLEYMLGDEQSYLWAVTTDTITSYELPGRAVIEEEAREVYGLLTARQSEFDSSADYQERVSAADAQYWQRAAALSRMVLGQVAAQIRDKRLLIVADGALQYIPFEALPEPDAPARADGRSESDAGSTADSATPLVLQHEIAYLPSASALASLRRERAGKESAPDVVIVLADPVFGRDDTRFPLALRDAADPGTGMRRLPSTLVEAEAIMDAAPRGRGRLVAGFRASRATVVGGEVSHYRIVHFATHGIINSEHPELSGIVLSLVNEGGGPENGFLQLHDIYNLKLSADLVVLSSCSTALGKDIKGEGLVGITRGFMYAGAGGVVASLWKVDDKASAELMNHFYHAMLQDGLPPAAALRVAKQKMWSQKRWHSPYYWAAFVLQGEYGQSLRDGETARSSALGGGAVAILCGALLVFTVARRKLLPALRRKHRSSATP